MTEQAERDTRQLSRDESKIKAGSVEHHMMGVEIGSLQRIADSLERLEWIAYAMILQSTSGADPKLDDQAEADLRALISRRMPGIPKPPESKPGAASGAEGDRPDHRDQGPSQGV